MAETVDLELRLDRDQTFTFTILNKAQTAAINIAGWTLSFMIKRNKSDADAAAILTNVSPTISGVYNATPSVNTQVAVFTIADTDCLSTVIRENVYWYELERTTAGFETPLAEGNIVAILGVQR